MKRIEWGPALTHWVAIFINIFQGGNLPSSNNDNVSLIKKSSTYITV